MVVIVHQENENLVDTVLLLHRLELKQIKIINMIYKDLDDKIFKSLQQTFA